MKMDAHVNLILKSISMENVNHEPRVNDAPGAAKFIARHTPGPWVVRVHQNWTDVDSKYFTVAGDVSNDDATLIAAAPDMLLALIWLVGLKDGRPHDYEEQKPLAWGAARAAIARATGAA